MNHRVMVKRSAASGLSRGNAGFSLVEVLLVLVIMGIIAAIVLPRLLSQGEGAKESKARIEVSKNGPYGKAIDLYYLDLGQYPEKLEDLQKAPDGLDEEMAKKYKGYLDADNSLKDPWGVPYKYVAPGQFNTESYDLSSAGKDKQEGTEDDITNWKVTR